MSSYQTQFASAAREEPVQVMWSHQQFSQLEVLCQVLDAIENGVLILNPQRQVIYINQPLAEFANLSDKDEAIGLRVGEAIGCDHAFTTFGGCGTTEFCRSCGAITAILIAQAGQANVQECRIARHLDNQFDALDLRVKATPLTVDGEKMTVFSVTNIADEKRRQVLEHIFFHDLRNTATVIHGVAELVEMQMGDAPLSQMLNRASHKLMDEIAAQQQLLAAENGRLELEMTDALSRPLLEELVALYTMQATDRGCEVCLSPEAENFLLVTDTAVLGRVLGNMIKNALEACAVGDTVTVGSRSANGRAYFWVHNPTFMRPHVQRQVFLRSFSTKGAQRGLGTYSMRLLSERFLGGQVSFVTDPTDGTTFTAVYPLRPDHPAAQMTTPERETAVAHTIPLSIIFAS